MPCMTMRPACRPVPQTHLRPSRAALQRAASTCAVSGCADFAGFRWHSNLLVSSPSVTA